MLYCCGVIKPTQQHAKLLIAVGRGMQRRALCCCNVKCDARARQLARSTINAKRNSREATDSAAEGTSHAMRPLF